MSNAPLKRFPRSATEAFPQTTDYACAVTRFDRAGPDPDRIVIAVCVLVLLALIPIVWFTR